MKHSLKKTFVSVIIIVLIIISVSYVTYAFFQSYVSKEAITGTKYNVDFNVNANVVYKASKLIPVSSETVDKAVNKATNKCLDNNNRDVCSLYEVSVTNTGVELSLNGFIKTNLSTYTTNNLKYKVYTKTNNTYTAITDDMTVSNEVDSKVYFKKNSSNYTLLLPANSTLTYYISFWINEVNGEQNDDQEKDYSCNFGFEGINGSKLSASFNI